VTSPETFGVVWLAPRLARFGRQLPALSVELRPSGEVLDLGRREAEVAVRFFRARQEGLVARRVGEVGHGLYASEKYLARRPVRGPAELPAHPLLLPADGPELAWVRQLVRGARPAFSSDVSLALSEAARADAGVALLPHYLGDATPGLVHVPMPREPTEPIWLTVHRDLRRSPRVRVLLEFLVEAIRADQSLLAGKRPNPREFA